MNFRLIEILPKLTIIIFAPINHSELKAGI